MDRTRARRKSLIHGIHRNREFWHLPCILGFAMFSVIFALFDYDVHLASDVTNKT